MFSRYLPCSILYDDPDVTKSFVPGKHCTFTFSHEVPTGINMHVAKKFADNIVAVVKNGSEPGITRVHAQRVLTEGFPPLMPKELIQQYVKTFDPKALNERIRGVFTAKPGAIRVERIATSMGCVIATCVVETKELPGMVNTLVSWAKPIIEVNAAKGKLCVEWRKHLEAKQQADMPLQDASAAAAAAATAAAMEQQGPLMNLCTLFEA